MTATSAFAQIGRAELRGRVTDQQGGALPGVTVIITNQDAGTFREVVTGGEGQYFAAQLIPGTFTITASLAGFSTYEQTDFVLNVGRTLDLNIEMTIGALEETITVSGQSPLVDLTSAEVGGTITQGELTDLPTANRSYFAAVALLPGIQFAPSASLGNDTMIANGQPQNANSVGVDGSANNDDASGTGAGGQVRVSIESVSEFQVLTNQFDAEFGRVRGAIINSITKQGTNQFTGALFNYYTGSGLTAEDFFVAKSDTLSKPVTNKKEFGGIIGGPILTDKMHFFFSLERQIVNPSRSREYETRPELSFTLAEHWTALNTLARLDHQINANNSWAFRWLREAAPQENLIGNRTATLNTTQDESDNDQLWVGTYTSVLGSSMVNTARGAMTSESWFRGNPCWRGSEGAGSGSVGRSGLAGSYQTTGRNQIDCPPEFEFNSFHDNQLAGAVGRNDENMQWGDTFSWYKPDMGGDHDFKFGGTFHRSPVETVTESDMGGTFRFDTDSLFNSADPTTYPERLVVRVGNPGGYVYDFTMTTWELFFQDKWAVSDRLTLGLGIRYDLELWRSADSGITVNPVTGGVDPIDRNNISPRTSFAYDIAGDGRSVVRGGYGMFYDKTLVQRVDDFAEKTMFSPSFTTFFPLNQVDPGPGDGEFPTEPLLLNFAPDTGGPIGAGTNVCPANPGGDCPFVDRDAIDALFTPGEEHRNTGDVYFDSPGRKQPWQHNLSLGYENELAPTLSASVDYIRVMGRDMLARFDYNPGLRAGTGRGDPVTRFDAFGVLGEPFATNVYTLDSVGRTNYDALNFQIEKRYSNRWGGRIAYAIAKSRGNTFNQNERILSQVGNQLNLDAFQQPAEADRKHILSMSARTELPFGITMSTVVRYMTGLPMTIHDSTFDINQNGILIDPIAAGTYSGAGEDAITVDNDGGYSGARGPDFFQMDARFGWRARPSGNQTIDIYFDIFNLTNRANFNNPSGDQRLSRFLLLRTLRSGSGIPRQGQFGVRFGF
jgi:hypothetical protein